MACCTSCSISTMLYFTIYICIYTYTCQSIQLWKACAGDNACVCLAVAVHLACFTGCSNDTNVMRFVKPYQANQHPPGTRLLTPGGVPVTKHSIRRVLAIVSRFYPLARPTRGMLKQVFNFFEPPHKLPIPGTVAAVSATKPAASATQSSASQVVLASVNAEGCSGHSEATQLTAESVSADSSTVDASSCKSSHDRSLPCLSTIHGSQAAHTAAAGVLSNAGCPVSPFVAVAEDTSKLTSPWGQVAGSLDRGTKSI